MVWRQEEIKLRGEEPHQAARTLQMEYAAYDNGEGPNFLASGGVATAATTSAADNLYASGPEKVVFTGAGMRVKRMLSEVNFKSSNVREIVSWQLRVEYHMAILLQCSKEYRRVIGLQCIVEYHVAILLQCSKEYRRVIGLQCRVEYHVAILLQCSKEYRRVIGLQCRVEYHMAILAQCSKEYHVAILLQSSMEYHVAIPPPSSKEYRRVIGPICMVQQVEIKRCFQRVPIGALLLVDRHLVEQRVIVVTKEEAQVRALDKKGGGGDQETVKPGTSTLPELRAPEPETSPVEVQDWLQLLQAPMADLSDNSHEWWTQVQALALKGYEQWATATPLERLAMKQPYSKELEEGRFSRLNSRAASMLLAALDSTVRADLVMRKSTQSATGILYRVLTLYQPGGENEKRLVLDQLQMPPTCTDPSKAAKSLRDWERWLRRAKDIGATTPDATVLARALSGIMKGVLESHPDAAFRTSLVKNELKLDTKPTNASVVAFHRHLLAEAEALSTGTKARNAAPTASSMDSSRTTPPEKQPRLKELKTGGATESVQTPKAKATPSPSSTTSPKPCRWFAKSDSGCKKGSECPFEHSWGGVSKAGRCLLCSAVGHVKKDCPTKDKALQTPSTRQRSEAQQSSQQGAGAANRAMNAGL
ncbi:CCDC147 [Symbiodinium sp. KB8]|nr:CCDC147 [Symbiodinium sp. KB8]